MFCELLTSARLAGIKNLLAKDNYAVKLRAGFLNFYSQIFVFGKCMDQLLCHLRLSHACSSRCSISLSIGVISIHR